MPSPARVLDSVLLSALIATAICLNAVPITPFYYYPESLPMDAPKRQDVLPGYAFFLICLVLVPILNLALWSPKTLPPGAFLELLLVSVGTISVAAISCSAIQILVGVPRPDSIAQCGTPNVTASHCTQVLSTRQAVDQFRSFPAFEPAIALSATVLLCSTLEFLLSVSPVLFLIIKGVYFAVAVLLAAFFIAVGAYRPVDVIGGAGLGALVALAASGLLATPRIPGKKENEASSELSLRQQTWHG
jgi:hypothetical protein